MPRRLRYIILSLAFISLMNGHSQDSAVVFNMDLEKHEHGDFLPDGWQVMGRGYDINSDSLLSHSGKYSIRIDKSNKHFTNQYGACVFEFSPAFEGKKIELRGFLKTRHVANGRAGLWMRIDGESGTLSYDNMENHSLDGDIDWTEYSIKLHLPSSAVRISFGALLTGTGTVWVDDFTLLVDGESILGTLPSKTPYYKAEKDHAFDKGSGLVIGNLLPAQVDNLAVLAKVWGFLKYYHPAVARGEYNWDYELLRILPKIVSVRHSSERNQVLAEWVKGLGTVKKGGNKLPKSKNVKLSPDLDWINPGNLGTELDAMLNRIRNSKRSEHHYYIGINQPVGNPEFKHEALYKENSLPDDGFSLLCLFRYWNAMRYFNPNRHLTTSDWDQVLLEFIPRFVGHPTTRSYTLTVMELICRVDDTHAGLSNNRAMKGYLGANISAVMLSFVEGKMVVTGFYDTFYGRKTGLKPGDIIDSVNGRPVEEIIAERVPITKGSNTEAKMRGIAESLLRSNNDLLPIVYRREGAIFSTKLKTYRENYINTYVRFERPDTCFRMVDTGIAYLYMGSFMNSHIPELMPEILKTDALIVDFRAYPADFTVFTLPSYLLDKPVPFVKFSTGSVMHPGLFTLQDHLETGAINAEAYKGQVIILVNEITQSSAEYHVMALRTVPGVIVMGSTTAGADGNVSKINLPGGIVTYISGIGVYYPDGRETQRIGIIPDIVVKPTIDGIKEGRDEVLEKAIQEVKRMKN